MAGANDAPEEGIDGVRAAGADPRPAPDLREQEPGGGDSYDEAELGEDCPVQPLGHLQKSNYFLDWAGQLIELDSRFQKGELMMLFGTQIGWLDDNFPQWKLKPGTGVKGVPPDFESDGFSQKDAQRALILACAKKQLFNPRGKVRGRGAHRGDHGELVLHCGDQVLTGAAHGLRKPLPPKTHRPGLVAGYVYPRADRLPVPAPKPAPIAIGIELVEMLGTWNWKDRTTIAIDAGGDRTVTVRVAAYLLLCWAAAATLGGALRHRPHVWITGPSGAGKTTLQQLLRDLMDQWGVFTEDASEAGVRQLLDQDTLPVMFDEIEPDADNGDVHMRIVKLARLAYSGGEALRGSQDHKAKSFVARSCFLFSSILHHELPQQDRNRMAVLGLDAFAVGTPPLEVPAHVKDWGSALRRRLIEQWHRFDATYEVYARSMLTLGYSGREQNTYGTLLAAGDLLLHDAIPDPTAMHESNRTAELVKALHHMIHKARAEAESTDERCLRHLASYRLPARSGREQLTVAGSIEAAIIEAIVAGEEKPARTKLKTHGLDIVNLKSDHDKGNGQGGLIDLYRLQGGYLAVAASSNKGAQEIFHGSTWSAGGWSQALGGISGAITNKKRRFGGPPTNCVLVPIGEVIDVDAVESAAAMVQQRLALDGEKPS